MTQAQLAVRLGIAERHVQQIEARDLNLTVRSLERIARHLDVAVVDLFAPPTKGPAKRGRPKKQAGPDN